LASPRDLAASEWKLKGWGNLGGEGYYVLPRKDGGAWSIKQKTMS